MNVMSEKIAIANPAEAHARDEIARMFEAAREMLPGDADVGAVRVEALETFAQQGLPHRRVEQWKYTDLRRLMGAPAPLATMPDDAALATAAELVHGQNVDAALTLVMVDGHYAPQLTEEADRAGIQVLQLARALGNPEIHTRGDLLRAAFDDAMVALNGVFASDGLIVHVPNGFKLDKPIHLVHVATQDGRASYTRSLMTIGQGAEVRLIETCLSAADGAPQMNDALQVWVGDDARFHHARLVPQAMMDAGDGMIVSSSLYSLGARARLSLFNLVMDGAMNRFQSIMKCTGEGARVDAHGAHLLRGAQHADMTILLDHEAPHCASEEVFRAVLDDRARSVFQGKIVVRPHAQKTDARMMTRALLLSDDAEMDAKPELEIHADDVACGHGATCGSLDENLMFYLRARGLPADEAEMLLIHAFIGDAVEKIDDEVLRDHVMTKAVSWLNRRRGS